MHNAILGQADQLLSYLRSSIERAHSIRFNVAFLLESGVKLIGDQLVVAQNRGAEIKILTGRYLSYTEPSAIYYLFNLLGKDLAIRFFNKKTFPFHPKAYLFDYDYDSEVYVGSSNLSRSALTSGVEWNYKFTKSKSPQDFQRFSNEFDDLFAQHAFPINENELRKYAINWNKPRALIDDISQEQQQKPEPRGVQIEALYEIKNSRQEGVDKGIVVAATGIGKTFISAFDAANFDKILFIAHREEILKQAYDSFNKVIDDKKMGFYTGKLKDDGCNIYFSTVQTLSKNNHLLKFEPQYFQYIIVDEFHHAAAESYQRILNYFKPEFMLGLTATPYRMDNKDIFALCEDNVFYEIGLKEAINRDILAPFKYYGIYDPTTDYNEIPWQGGGYDTAILEGELSKIERANLIFEKYEKVAGKKTLAFCVGIDHAEFMAQYFRARGKKAVAVHSRITSNGNAFDREAAVESLQNGELDIIFAVDIFNEGVDIPSLDTVMFLRPTDSYVVFLQQLGRGLRKAVGKAHLKVLDFIGNYKRAHFIPLILAGENPMLERISIINPDEDNYPIGCQVNFDFAVMDLFEKIAQNDPLPQRMRDEYFRLKYQLGRRPSRVDIYQGTDIVIREFLRDGWLDFLQKIDELKDEEKQLLKTPAEEFLQELEKTKLTKSYKIPTIKAFIAENNIIKTQVSLEEIGKSFFEFYNSSKVHQKDLQKTKSTENWQGWSWEKFAALAKRNPVRFLSNSKFFHYDELNKVFYLDESMRPYLSKLFTIHVEDILEYRRKSYFRRRFKEINLKG